METELPSVITEWAVPLASQRGTEWWASGTAVIVAPYLAITAKHVIDDHWLRHQGDVPDSGEAVGEFSLVAFQAPQSGDACLWAVRRIWPSPHTDVAFLKLVPWSVGAASYVWRWATINVLPPPVGSYVAAFGYHDSKIVAGNPIRWQHRASNSFGRVRGVFSERRDTVLRDYPCFSVDARFDGGMSGGPVFNEAGELCGLVCSSIPPVAPETEHTSYVTTLWPALGTLLDLERQGCPPGRYPALELARGRQMVVRNWERVSVEWSDSGASTVALVKEDAG
ncbi:MAG: serine protease [Vicinamibacterales bacterium]